MSVPIVSSPESSSTRLLFVVNKLSYFFSHRLPLAKEALARGYEVHVAAPEDSARSDLEKLGIKFHALPLSRSGTRPWEEFGSLLTLYRIFRRVEPNTVHLVTIKPVIYGGLVSHAFKKTQVVAAVPGLGFVFSAQGLWASVRRAIVIALYRAALKNSRTKAIFQNPDDRAVFMENKILPENQTVLIPGSGVDLEEFSAKPEPSSGPVKVLLPARMLRDKGVLEFIQAAQVLESQKVEAEFWLAGDVDPGNPASLTEKEIRSWEEKVKSLRWLGFQSDMPKLLASCHIVCLPSFYREGLPKSLIEASASQRAIVTTDFTGCRDAIEDGVSGILVPIRDMEALASALKTLIQNPSERKRLAQGARKRAEAIFSIEDVIKKTFQIYDGEA
jgi:glycosyltransferase involved in cell wall biosynthesis